MWEVSHTTKRYAGARIQYSRDCLNIILYISLAPTINKLIYKMF
jgi:hypothetical protein